MKNTTYNQEAQGILARLLSKENITVQHGNFRTAFFDTDSRVLGLPIWTDRGREVYNLLTGHEVGHALYTPQSMIEEYKEKYSHIPFDLFNIVEDIRIEKLIQNQYPGLKSQFEKGYAVLKNENFFGDLSNINDENFLNRLNVKGKLRSLVDITFNAEESEFHKRCLEAETPEDVVQIVLDIYEYLKNKDKQTPKQTESGDDSEGDSESPENSQSEEGESEEDENSESISGKSENSDDESDDQSDEEESEGQSSEETDSEGEESEGEESEGKRFNERPPESELDTSTMTDFERNLQNEAIKNGSGETMNVVLPSLKEIKNLTIPYTKIMEETEKLFREIFDSQSLSSSREKFPAFKKETERNVNILIREFDRRKQAWQYSRAQESRSGVIDVNKLHRYKFDDQIFSSVTNLADAKNHGMVFLLDFSGSMAYQLKDVIHQTLNLVLFCKKVGIPFEVYSFTSGYTQNKNAITTKIYNTVNLEWLKFCNLLSSKMTKNQFNTAFEQMYIKSWLYDCGYTIDSERLGGTPLNECILMLHRLVRDFVNTTRVQKMNTIILTDGDAQGISLNKDSHEAVLDSAKAYNKDMVTNIDGKTISFPRFKGTENLIKSLSEICNNNVIGFFLPNRKSDIKRKLNDIYDWNREKVAKSQRMVNKEGHFFSKNVLGYNSYFILPVNVGINDSEEFHYEKKNSEKSISENKTEQNRLAKQFAKFNSEKRKKRIILTKFAEEIA